MPAMYTGCNDGEGEQQGEQQGETQGRPSTQEDTVLGTLRDTTYIRIAQKSVCGYHGRHWVEMASEWEP